MDTHTVNEAEAAAALVARQLSYMGVVSTSWKKDETNVVCATTEGAGPYLLNLHSAFDVDIHLVAETSKIREAGKLPEAYDGDEHGAVFFNMVVEGLTESYGESLLATDTVGNLDVTLKDSVDEDARKLAEVTGRSRGV
jgi:hypothetical protein